MYLDIALLAGAILIFSCIAGRVDKSWVTGPILYVGFGFAIGPLGFDLLSFQIGADTIRFLAELTLALVLFIDAASADLKILRRESAIPMRMLLIGLPMTLLAGFGVGVLFFDALTFIEIALLATILAPTDAALGQAVVKDPSVPANLRQSLNAESGLNDGICVPILYLFLALAASTLGHGDSGGGHGSGDHLGLTLLVQELGIGLAVGVVLVILSHKLLELAREKGWLTHVWVQLPIVALAITCFATAQYVGGSGFIAVFCGGLLYGYLAKDSKEKLLHSAEGYGEVFALVTWILFGAAVLGSSIPHLSWPVVGYAVLSLTLLRMVPIYLSLIGTKVSHEGKLFLGWFGPRGLASIVFAVLVLDANLPHESTIVATVSVTVILSIILHGLTASPWAGRWKKNAER